MGEGVTLLLFAGGVAAAQPEAAVDRARHAVALDTVDRALRCPSIGRIVVATGSQELIGELEGLPVEVDPDPPGEAFHFGRRLQGVVARRGVERALYMGAGSGALLPAEELEEVARDVLAASRVLVTNNLYSTDFAGFAPADAVLQIEPPATDNDLSWLLGEGLGLPTRALPRTASTQFDVDTPTDLMILSRHPAAPERTRRLLETLSLDAGRLEEIMDLLVSREREILLAGRVSMGVASHVEAETACRVRLVSEERGMRASGRLAEGGARSLLGLYLGQVGPSRFFQALSQLADGILLDSRVLMAHRGALPGRADRFRSDLGLYDEIEDPFLADFTRASREAGAPVVMGGHSLVAGGLYALIEASWRRLDGGSPQAPTPQP